MKAARFIAKLEHYVRLSDEDKTALYQLFTGQDKILAPRQDLIRSKDSPSQVNILTDGWACRYVDLQDGRRQIVALLLPGDACDAGPAYLRQIDHSIGAITAASFAEIPFDQFEDRRAASRRLDVAMQWNALVEVSIARRWILNIGQHSAVERIAHLFCEIWYRLSAVECTSGFSFEFPLTQEQLGQATGLSAVHVNRSLQQLRGLGLITLNDKKLTIRDLERLRELALFDPDYLHLGREGRAFDATD